MGGIILCAVAFVGFNVATDTAAVKVETEAGARFTCSVLSVFDGDGPIQCAEVDKNGQAIQVRLLGIEARELDGTCNYSKLCSAASGDVAKAELTRLAAGRLTCISGGPTSFERIAASCTNRRGEDLSCALLKSGTVVRWPEYDPNGRLLRCRPQGV